MTPSERLRFLLARRGYTVADAADAAGMFRQQLWRIIAGKVPNPGILTVERIVEAVGASMHDLYPDQESTQNVLGGDQPIT
jgi:transcriptional regulator with XRE-family HTH domain